jgi:hypothetical protein
MEQPGDGSTHHYPLNAPFSTPIQSCPKVKTGCGESNRDGVKFTNEYGVGHFPPFVALAAVKNAYTDCATSDVCNWFDYDTHGCSIPKSTMDMLVYEYFGVDDRIEFNLQSLLMDCQVTRTTVSNISTKAMHVVLAAAVHITVLKR